MFRAVDVTFDRVYSHDPGASLPRQLLDATAVVGTIGAGLGLIVLQQLFHVYTSLAGRYQAYGIIGAVLLFLLWLYFGAFVLLLGPW